MTQPPEPPTPAEQEGQPAEKNKSGLLVLLAALGGVGLLLVIGIGVLMFMRLGEARRIQEQTICNTRLKGFANALALYEAEENCFPYLGNRDRKIWAEPTALPDDARSSAQSTGSRGRNMWGMPIPNDAQASALFTAGDNVHCNLQPMWLLIETGGVGLGQFQCPSDERHQERSEDGFGFEDWYNSSYAIAPISKAYPMMFRLPMADPGMVIMGDRPRAGHLQAGSDNHESGGNFLMANGAVRWEEPNDFGFKGNNVYRLDLSGDDAAYDSFLHFAGVNDPDPAQP